MILAEKIKAAFDTFQMQLDGFAKDAYAKDLRIADLERQLAEASAQSVEQDDEHYYEPAFRPDGSSTGKPLGQLIKDRFNSIEQDMKEVKEASAPAVEQQPIGYISNILLTERRKTFERDGAVMYSQPAGMYTTPVFAAPQAADTDKVREVWKHDAESFGNALNEACWTFTESAPEGSISAMLWNHLKPTLRTAILKYSELVSASMAAQAPVREVPGWISISDRLPPDDCRVLVATWFDFIMEQKVEIAAFRAGSGTFSNSDVTHWMPLPTAPVQQEPKP